MSKTLSFCIPVHNRLDDLKKSLPHLMLAAGASPPAEVVILDYNSPDGLEDYIRAIANDSLTYRKYTGRNYYHMAHARNLSVKAASGEYIIIMSADIYPTWRFLPKVRQMLAENYVWLQEPRYKGVIVCERQEFIDAGGYDERFEFYSPEDKDLEARLIRRCGKYAQLPGGLISVIPTPDTVKIKNYREQLSKREMSERMKPIFEKNQQQGILVANEGVAWGQW